MLSFDGATLAWATKGEKEERALGWRGEQKKKRVALALVEVVATPVAVAVQVLVWSMVVRGENAAVVLWVSEVRKGKDEKKKEGNDLMRDETQKSQVRGSIGVCTEYCLW